MDDKNVKVKKKNILFSLAESLIKEEANKVFHYTIPFKDIVLKLCSHIAIINA